MAGMHSCQAFSRCIDAPRGAWYAPEYGACPSNRHCGARVRPSLVIAGSMPASSPAVVRGANEGRPHKGRRHNGRRVIASEAEQSHPSVIPAHAGIHVSPRSTRRARRKRRDCRSRNWPLPISHSSLITGHSPVPPAVPFCLLIFSLGHSAVRVRYSIFLLPFSYLLTSASYILPFPACFARKFLRILGNVRYTVSIRSWVRPGSSLRESPGGTGRNETPWQMDLGKYGYGCSQSKHEENRFMSPAYPISSEISLALPRRMGIRRASRVWFHGSGYEEEPKTQLDGECRAMWIWCSAPLQTDAIRRR